MNMKKRSWILIITSVLFLAFLCVGTLVTPEVGFSENENRYLQAAPKLTVDHVLNGRFETQAEDYLNDQIIGRSLWVRTMAMTEAALGVGDINGVYLAADGRVVKRVTEADFDWERYQKNLREAAALAAQLRSKRQQTLRDAGADSRLCLSTRSAEPCDAF